MLTQQTVDLMNLRAESGGLDTRGDSAFTRAFDFVTGVLGLNLQAVGGVAAEATVVDPVVAAADADAVAHKFIRLRFDPEVLTD